jgi:hypothetical protein
MRFSGLKPGTGEDIIERIKQAKQSPYTTSYFKEETYRCQTSTPITQPGKDPHYIIHLKKAFK